MIFDIGKNNPLINVVNRISYLAIVTLTIACTSKKRGLTPEERDTINRKYYNSQRDQAVSENLVKNIFADAKHGTLKYSPVRVKGRMLYQLIEHPYWLWSEYDKNGDGDKDCEKAVLTVIKTIIDSNEWKEVLKHIAIKNPEGSGYIHYDKDIVKGNPDVILSLQESVKFLERLIDDVKDWNQLCDHVNNIEALDKTWWL